MHRLCCSTSVWKCLRALKMRALSRSSGDGTHSISTVSTLIYLVKFLLILTGVVGAITFLSKIVWIPFYGTILGFASMSIEATLGLPQLISNHRNKSVQGLSFFMIFTWFAGDFLKTLYFIIEVSIPNSETTGTVHHVRDHPAHS